MSLNNLRLPDILLSELYKNIIVAPLEPTQEVNSPEEKDTPLSFLGENRLNITVLVAYETEVYLPEQALQFLANILKACGLNLGDIAILNISRQPLSLDRLREELFTKKTLIFGLNAGLLTDKEIPYFSIIPLNGIQVLNVPSLEGLNQPTENSKILKSRLWLCLKELFEVP